LVSEMGVEPTRAYAQQIFLPLWFSPPSQFVVWTIPSPYFST